VNLNPIMELNLIIALALAFGIGLSLGLLGSGGSIITLPVLVYVAGVPVASAVGMSLAIVGGTSLNRSQNLFITFEYSVGE
jgi:uncharacterized membrane protein YfcA